MTIGRATRDHGGGLDAARAIHGGDPADWIDLSTGINPQPYPLPTIPPDAWTRLPDHDAGAALTAAARRFWLVPDGAAIVAAPGASALIARIPLLAPTGAVAIAEPTYNEHAAAFDVAGWTRGAGGARVVVHPNNPDGRLHEPHPDDRLLVVDESFCDVMPDASLIRLAAMPGVIVLKSFGKFWGLAGLRLGFAIGDPALITRLADMLGPWPVSGPALITGRTALSDHAWAEATRLRLACDAERLDCLITKRGARLAGGTTLFRLYEVDDAARWQERLARRHVWSRIFPYSRHWLRLGLPPEHGWPRLEALP